MRGKLLGLVLAASILPLVILAVLSFQSARTNLEEMIGRQLVASSRSALGELSADLTRDGVLLASWAELSVMQDALTDDGDGAIQRQIPLFRQRFPQFGDIAVLNDQGKVVAATRKDLTGTVLAKDPLYTGARAGKAVEGPLGTVAFAKAKGLPFASPIRASYDANTVIGVLVGVVDWKYPREQLANVDVFGGRQSMERHAALVDAAGQVLYGFDGVSPAELTALDRTEGSNQRVVAGGQTLVGTAVDTAHGWVLHQIVGAAIAYGPVNDLRNQSALLGLIMVPLVALAAIFASNRFVTPILGITGAMNRLAGGDMEVDLAMAKRGDEIGAMGRAVEVFRDNAVRVARLQAEQEETKIRAEVERKEGLKSLAGCFEASIKGIVCIVSSSSTELESSAQSLTAIADHTVDDVSLAVAAAESASASTRTVSAASDHLAASIGKINGQVARSATIARSAAKGADHVNSMVTGLANAVTKIGDVVQLINDIASQTNLLALNATIEAARAGDAGKGFAIVAHEVKNLATQTARATDEITSQITAVQNATSGAVEAIASITGTITEINEIAGAIAAAVAEEDVATREIATNVDLAAAGTVEVARHMGDVKASATETGTASTHVLEAARELSVQAEKLRGDVDAFITHIYKL